MWLKLFQKLMLLNGRIAGQKRLVVLKLLQSRIKNFAKKSTRIVDYELSRTFASLAYQERLREMARRCLSNRPQKGNGATSIQ